MGELSRHTLDAVHAAGSCGNALIVVWRQAPTPPAIDGIHETAERLLDRFPDGIGLIGVALASVPLVGASERQQWGRLLSAPSPRLFAVASVIEGSSVLAGTTRSVMSAIHRVAKHPCPLRIFGTVDEAVAWMSPLLGGLEVQRPSATGLRHAVNGLRRELS